MIAKHVYFSLQNQVPGSFFRRIYAMWLLVLLFLVDGTLGEKNIEFTSENPAKSTKTAKPEILGATS